MATTKQKLAFKKVLKGTPISHAMREVGYAPSTAATTTKLTASDGWQELLDKYLPEKDLMRAAKEGLKATKLRFDPEGNEINEKDYAVRHKYVETGLKLRGKLKDNGKEGGDTTNNFLIIGGDQLKRIASRILDGNTESEAAPGGLPDSNQS